MKKLTLALACASTLALFATDFSVATFEAAGLLGKTVGAKDDAGGTNGDIYWKYDVVSGSADGSVVKAYGDQTPPRPTGQLSGTPGDNYLALSTEGGTLWRSVNPNASGLGAPQAIAKEGQIYIDTMVQFTATEDGNAPDVDSADKLAIWLDADTEAGTKTLKVLANAFTFGEDGPAPQTTPFALVPADGSTLAIEPGAWYRLSVKSVANVLKADAPGTIQGFQIRVDGKLMKAASGEPFAPAFGDFLDDTYKTAALTDKTVFASLQQMGNSGDPMTLTAVGFKGSGAIDDVVITEDELFGPTVAVTGVTLSQTTAEITVGGDTLTLTAKVLPENATNNKVKWATSDETIATVVDGVVTAVAAGEVEITATADGKSAKCVVTVKAAAKQYPEYIAEADKFKYDAWVSAYGVTDRVDTGKALQAAYLLNVAPAEAEDETKKFAITSITVNADGTVTVDASKNSKGDLVNGKVEIWGAPALEGPWDLQTTGHKFFKAILK